VEADSVRLEDGGTGRPGMENSEIFAIRNF
jgi:hypothetical protein